MRFILRAATGFVLFIIAIAITLGLLGVLAGSMSFERPQFGGRDFERTWTVTTMTIEKSDVSPKIQSFGTVAAKDISVVRPSVGGTLYSKAPGLDNGTFVGQGDILFQLDPFTFETSVSEAQIALAEAENQRQRLQIDQQNAEAQIESARVGLALATDTLARQQQLFDQGVVSQSAVDNASNQASAAQATLEARQFSVSTAQNQVRAQDLAIERAKLTLQRAEKSLGDATITAPISGVVSDLNFVLGALVGTNEALLTLTDPSTYQVRFQLTDAAYARFFDDKQGLRGRDVSVTWQVGDDALAFQATVAQVSTSVEQSNGGIQVLADFVDLPADTALRQGAFVSIELEESVLRDVFVLPIEAVSEDGDVFVIADGRLTEIDGNILRRLDDQVAVSLALDPGAQIVSKRYGQLAPGVKVEVFDEEAQAASTAQATPSDQSDRPERPNAEGGNRGGGNSGSSGGGQPAMIDITPEQAAKAKELLAGFPIPDERKAVIMQALDNNQIPERLAGRIGAQIGL